MIYIIPKLNLNTNSLKWSFMDISVRVIFSSIILVYMEMLSPSTFLWEAEWPYYSPCLSLIIFVSSLDEKLKWNTNFKRFSLLPLCNTVRRRCGILGGLLVKYNDTVSCIEFCISLRLCFLLMLWQSSWEVVSSENDITVWHIGQHMGYLVNSWRQAWMEHIKPLTQGWLTPVEEPTQKLYLTAFRSLTVKRGLSTGLGNKNSKF